MTLFAPYEPRGPDAPRRPLAIAIEEAGPGDLDAVAALAAERNEEEPGRMRRGIRRRLADPERASRLFVARVEDEVAGYAWVGRLAASTIPGGWYLTGLVVAPDRRRHGIGRALTAHRLRWLAKRTDVAWYFANARNRPTIDLHAALGFEEAARGIAVPGCAFEGGIGVLYRCSLRPGSGIETRFSELDPLD